MFKINKNKILDLDGITNDVNNNIIIDESISCSFIQITFLLQEYFRSFENYDGEDICNNNFRFYIIYELILRDKNIYIENFGLDFYECLFPNVMLFLKYFCDEITIQLN